MKINPSLSHTLLALALFANTLSPALAGFKEGSRSLPRTQPARTASQGRAFPSLGTSQTLATGAKVHDAPAIEQAAEAFTPAVAAWQAPQTASTLKGTPARPIEGQETGPVSGTGGGRLLSPSLRGDSPEKAAREGRISVKFSWIRRGIESLGWRSPQDLAESPRLAEMPGSQAGKARLQLSRGPAGKALRSHPTPVPRESLSAPKRPRSRSSA